MAIELPDDVKKARTFSAFEKLCTEKKVPKDVRENLEFQVECLRIFKNDLLPNSKTATQRAKQFSDIEKTLNKLKLQIEQLSFIDRAALDNDFFDEDHPDFIIFAGYFDPHFFDIGGWILPAMIESAERVGARLDAVGVAGRSATVARYADFVRCIAQDLMPIGIKPSRDGVFCIFCESMFEAAGLQLPVRALRYFLKNIRPEVKKRGLCL